MMKSFLRSWLFELSSFTGGENFIYILGSSTVQRINFVQNKSKRDLAGISNVYGKSGPLVYNPHDTVVGCASVRVFECECDFFVQSTACLATPVEVFFISLTMKQFSCSMSIPTLF